MTRPLSLPDPFEAQRPLLLRLAYRMLGSRAESEDIVQEAWLRWQAADRGSISEPAAYLSRIVTRLCLDALKSARARRETYIGFWLPEPVAEPPEEEMRADELTLTLMLALERLSPLERAAFLLHDVFEVPLDEIATTLERAPATVRQLAARARRHVREARPRYPVGREEGDRLARAFFDAATKGDLQGLSALLAENAVLHSDGGGKVIAFHNPIAGLPRLLRLYAGLERKRIAADSVLLRPLRIDGLPGYLSRERGGILQTTAFDIRDGRIAAIYVTRNPDKLERLVAEMGL
ncbi:MAG: sigma-70 family RNA polymerase sigma factor [Alphaproteobacteria bacterium]|nr:sigma-70 family RNA polymerase sigma factor [Alphaproteobacteria bacterium]MBU0799249.1 sigma-70 family RNA polymerase sigma factor [Alphaproteobacteria bacterium]MBU0885562.1 sigma-70 family RNA polymerase sigma factor [Alphaproteobacteria bacterium]MBU1812961.1 sigma-70 family RNA polymerase sigma factor [Alphaproteobacteria bacterium]